MTEQAKESDEAGSRFPFVNLQKALARAKELYKAARDHDVLISDAFGTWGYSLKSSGGHQTVAALKMYGLVRVSGVKDERKLALTDDGLRYFRDEREDVLASLTRNFAVAPRFNRTLYAKWGTAPPADNIARSYLKMDCGLSDQAARSLLAIYKENLSFAKLKGSDRLGDGNGNGEAEGGLPPPPPPRSTVMEGERVLADGLLSKNTTFRVIVAGRVGPKEIERLIKKLEVDKEILSEPDEDTHAPDDGESDD